MALQEVTENRGEMQAAETQVISRMEEICRIALRGHCDTNAEVVNELSDNEDAIKVLGQYFPDMVSKRSAGDYGEADEMFCLISKFLVASAVAKRTKAKRKEKPTAKKFVPPPAKLLIFNLAGKAVEDIDYYDDCAYLAKKGFSLGSRMMVPALQEIDWEKQNSFKSAEEREKAFAALAASPNPPRWMVRFLAGPKKDTPDNPAPPAA